MADPISDRRLPRFSIWAAPDGWPCRLLDWPPEGGLPIRGALIFAGGRGDFIEKHLEALAHWRKRGWHVTAFDWRGQGGSRGSIVGGHYDSFDPLVDDLAALIAARGARSPGAPLVAIGHSMGGHVLLRAMADGRTALDAAVLVSPMVRVNSWPIPPGIAAAIASLMVRLGFARHPLRRTPASPPPAGSRRQRILTGSAERYLDELEWWRREPGYDLGAPSWGWLKAAYASSAKLAPERLRAIRAPVLILATDRDRLVSPSAIRQAAGAIPNCELVMFANSGHEILREADPVRESAMARIDSFLDARAPTP
jgi:lysophospholipase